MTTTDEILHQEERLRAAMLAGDVAELDRLIHKDLMFAGADGTLATKADDLAAHAGGMIKILALDVKERNMVLHPQLAVVSVQVWLVVQVGVKTIEGNYRYNRVWVLEDERWQAIIACAVQPMAKA
jgi:hypothetical protein